MHRVGLVVYPSFQLVCLAASSVFEVANLVLDTPAYQVSVRSEAGGAINGSGAVTVLSEPIGEVLFDSLIVCGGGAMPEASDALARYLQRATKTAQRIAAICTGSFILAQAGLLANRRATTHWMMADALRQRYPDVHVEADRIFIQDGQIWTSAGMTAGIDLALAMVEADHGIIVAKSVARQLVLYHRRAGGQSQHSALLDLAPKSDRIQNALTYARSNLKNTLSLDELAEAAHLSSRQFSRAFRDETGQTPAKAVERLRVEAARLMLEDGRHTVETVAYETGFADRERMRRAFLRTLGQPPQTVRRNAQV
ncbi:GlxA family transcriptional regulator [Bradyrhizobium sp. INPA01-394B]|uniref:GlxA family transcriptional regulator n=1 Tax=Bradyrhizobium campsiandrae TaxID=1729892 RepID=A0ABR7U3C7_9BRAD|nr:GlxA family transcriptional regulator [Bradyrhizobium campsiandrae]MBC9879874.1 GlxA family transcriptional regulator [Bradyrhizobium campsiandrae]MBC9978559.1 GlxA family transcriptional regulator [Bradyrhizobium campsiandrae]